MPPAGEGRRAHCPRFEWLKIKKDVFLGIEIPGDSLHSAMKCSLLGKT